MHYSITIALAEDGHRFCRCGAASEHPYGMCRKCHARMTWRRHKTRPRRRTVRRRSGRLARDRARILTFAKSSFRTTGKEADL
jgi:CDGSH-type Zn-finger protein